MTDEPAPSGPASSPPPTPTPAKTPAEGKPPEIVVEVPPVPPFKAAFPYSPLGTRDGRFEFDLGHMFGGMGAKKGK